MRSLLLLLLLPALAAPCLGDVLTTRDGRVLDGLYLGGTQQAVRFKTGDSVEVLLVEEVRSITFSSAPTSAATPRPAPGRPSPAEARTASSTRRPTTAARPAPGTGRATAAAKPAAPVAPASGAAAAAGAGRERPGPAAAARATAPTAAPSAAAAPAVVQVPAGTRLQVRMIDGIDTRQSAAGDRFAASLEVGLGVNGVPVVPAGTRLYGQVVEVRSGGPVTSRLKLELSQVMLQGELRDIVTGNQKLNAAEENAPAAAAAMPSRPGIAPGALLEFRLLQPFEVRLR